MADSNEKPRSSRSRRDTSGAESRRSGASRSRASSPLALTRYVSGYYIDDQAQYHDHHYHHHEKDEEAIEDENGSIDTEGTEDVSEGSSESIVPEVRDGIEAERDLEAGPKLQREKTSRSRRSVRDPNLVTWEGPDDTANPKNWTFSRKWAATLVGEYSFSLRL
jgi:hypothetical protein